MSRIITKIANKESLTTKRSLIFIGLTAAVVCGGYILFLAIAAPQQLAEATTAAASNVVCNGCVGSSDIADNSIYSVDIRDGQVASLDIADGRVRAEDIGTGQVRTGEILDDTITSADLGSSAVQRVVKSAVIIGAGDIGTVNVDCPPGGIVTGGGFISLHANIHVFQDLPFDANTWRVGIWNQHPDNIALNVYALCI